MTKKILTTVVVLASTFGFIACESSSKRETPKGRKNVPPVVLDQTQVQRGAKLYNQMCAACHQTNGAGKTGMAPRLNSPDFLGIANDTFIKRTILEGRNGTAMMAYKVIPTVANNIDDLTAYIRSWQNDYVNYVAYDVDWTSKISGDATSGRKAFRRYCSSCHGPNGGGYADGGSGPGIGLEGFLKAASDDYIKKTIEIGRAGTAMRPFGHGRGLANLDDKEIKNIVAFLRGLAI